ncbi:hypothetical protein AA0121_g5526 [Alternaria tenuissima]|uniref:2,6-dihydroxypyridine 3-monooxygenase substrate binding domain-containing protein n=1 Tax=Alternaria tenuissima TaxID=119927 RepID=A0A4Q4MKD5_9PLEO|nr:hypothetical protein B0T12DRAFT_402364 [Alternaria alternata]RYN32562.1 hypothetical protein AA0115_g3715 [Alternaria tenuissima]RYN53241.1 hypothetical protein AA0114_g4340 [Alternaria tenuissima]RYO17888.1 hypothetical protein AA0121_g5526 [Alternaria tenuissima]
MSERRKLVIVGGSLTGLTVANLCQNECDVILLEQNNALYSEKHNGGFSLGRWGRKIFEEYIPAPDLLERSIRGEQLLIFSPDNDEMVPVPEEHRVVMTTWLDLYQVLLRDVVVESEKNWKTASEARPTLRIDANVEDAQYEDGRWTITYRSTATNRVETETADMLVAADGAQSTIRRLTSPGVVPSYEQVVAWRGRVPADVSVDEEKEIDERIKKGLLVWYKMHGSQYIILYGVPGFGNADDNDDTVIEWCWYHPYEQDTDRDLENVMTTFIDRGRLVKGRAEKWKDYLNAAKNSFPKSIWEMLSKCETPWITKVIAAPLTMRPISVDELDEDNDDEETDDESWDQGGDTSASSPQLKRLWFAGEAYAPLPPFLGSTFEPGAEHAVAILNLIQGKSDERELRSWQSGGTAQRLWSSKMAGWEGMGLPDTEI